MNNTFLPGTEYRRWFIISFIVMVVTAWFSVGYFHPDEHYQVLEFYNYKKGLSPLADLPWEYNTHCRPALQPFMVYCIAGLLDILHITDPFILAFVTRLIVAVLTWYTTYRLVRALALSLGSDTAKRLYALCSLFLWFVPYIGVRFSSETMASDCFFLAMALLWEQNNSTATNWRSLVAAGLLMGFSLFFRLQMGFAFVGLGIWLLFVVRWHWLRWVALVMSAVTAIGLSVIVDHWFYGVWTFSPYNYFDVNIIQNIAAKFGVEPWWWYLPKFLNMGIIPISLPLAIFFFIGLWKKPLHLFSLIAITFFAGHFLIGHKEMRFLFPGSFALVYIACLGFDEVLGRARIKKGFFILFRTLVVIDVAVLVFKMFTPAEEVMKYYRFIYCYAQERPTTLVCFGKSPYQMDNVVCNFYKPRNMDIRLLQDTVQLSQVLNTNTGRSVICLSDKLTPPKELAGYKTERIYCEFPDWVLRRNVNHWQERSYIWAVYRVQKVN